MRFGCEAYLYLHSDTSFPISWKRGLSILGRFFPARPQLFAADQKASSPMSKYDAHYELRCRECGKTWGNQPRSICEDCFSPLEVAYDYDALRREFTREKIAQGPPSMWRYRALLPLPENYEPSVPAGFTPLLAAPR